MVMDEIKAGARKHARAARQKAHEVGGLYAAQAAQLLVGFLADQKGKVIAGYMPIGTEIDPRPAMIQLSQTAQLAVPVVVQKAHPLRFDRWSPEADMVPGAFGARVPKASEPVVPDVVIVPMLAFDRNGHRLGYGGGFYDRTLAALRAQQDVFAVGLAYAAQELKGLPFEATDAPLDAIVTEREVLTF